MSIYLTDEIEVKTKKGKMGAAKQIFLEGDTQTVEKEIQDINSRHNTLNTKHESLNKTVQGIAATGGASTATNVTYDNTNSGMTAENIQDAVDELAKEKADSSDVTEQLDKVTIKDEDGTVVDTPFRYIQNEEFVFAEVDAEDKLLFGILWDGTPKFGKTSEVEDELQEQITTLAERVAAIIGDEDITSTIDTMNELKTFFANIENTQSLTDILANLDNVAKNLDKTVIKDEEGNVQDTPFRVIENEEFIMAVVDSEDRVLFGIYKATGKPHYPLNEMYHISHSEEFLWVILDAANHPLLGIKEDGTCWAAKAQWLDDIKTIKEALSSIDETIKTFQPKEEGKGLINMEIADSFFYISNDEYIIAVVDSENRILVGIKYDGKPYFPLNEMYHVEQNEEFFALWLDTDNHVLLGIRRDGVIIGEIHAVNALKETIKEFQKDIQDDISSLRDEVGVIDSNLKELLDIFSLQENPEYMAVEKDADGKVLSATYNDGSHYSHNLKSETIDAKVDKKEGKSLIDADVADAHSTLEDPEGRTEITTDAEDKVMSYRNADGVKNELVGFNSSQYYQNNKKKEWIEEKDVLPIVKNTDGDIPLNIMGGITDHNTINLLVPSEIKKTFSDGVNSFSPPNAGYELSNRIECKAGDWFSRTGTATGMIIVTDANDKNGKRLFASDGSTLGSTFQIPDNLTDVKYIRMAVDAEAAKAGNVAICKGKNAFEGEQKGDFLTIDKLRVTSSNMPKDLKFIKTSNGDYYELYIDESDFSVKARKIDPSVITELPDDFPVFNCSGDFTTYFNSWVAMVDDKYLVERNQNGVTNYLKLGANAYSYAEFRKETTPGGIPRYVAMFPYTSYTGLKGEKGLTIYNKDFDVVDTNIKVGIMPDAHDFIYFDDNHLIVCGYGRTKNVTIRHNNDSFTAVSVSLCIQEIKKINGVWQEIASFDTNDYPTLLTDGIQAKSPNIMIHWNTVQLDYDGNLIVNMRNMNCFWKIRRTVDHEGNVIIGSKTKDYNEAVIGRVGGIYNSAFIDTKRVLEEGFKFTDVPSSLTDISSDEIPLWKFYREHDVTYWGKKAINGKEYPTYILFDNNMWTGETSTQDYYDINPRNNYNNNPNGNNDTHFIYSKSDGGAYDEKMVSRVVQLSIDWDTHTIMDYRVYEISKKYSNNRSSVQMFDEGVLFISWTSQHFCGVFNFNDEQTVVDGKLYKNGKMLFSSQKTSYRVHGYK